MSTLSKLFSGYTGGGHVAKNGKFSTTKNNHNRDKYGRPTVIGVYSMRILQNWIKDDEGVTLPSYMNPEYRRAYHQPKRAYK